jgi:hypothetical protein
MEGLIMNEPAFPTGTGVTPYKSGMTLRDYFAAKAMQAMTHRGESNEKFVAEHSYLMADAMLKAREA